LNRNLHEELVLAVLDYLDMYNRFQGTTLREHKASSLRKQLQWIEDLAKIRQIEVQIQRKDHSKAGIKNSILDVYKRKVNEFKEQKQRKKLGAGSSKLPK